MDSAENITVFEAETAEPQPKSDDTYFETFYTSWIAYLSIAYNVCTAWILLANSLTLSAFVRARQLRIRSNILVISLTVVDILTGLSALIRPILNGITGNDDSFHTCYWVMVMQMLPVWVSILHLLSISIERYFAVFYPLKYQTQVTERMLGLVVLCNWIVGGFLCVISMAWDKRTFRTHCMSLRFFPSDYLISFLLVPYTASMITMVALYARIYTIAKGRGGKFQNPLGNQDQTSAGQSAKPSPVVSKATVTLLLVCGVAVCCYTPFMVSVGIMVAMESQQWVSILYYLTLVLLYANSGMNSVIYIFRNARFRRSLLHMFCCCRRQTRAPVESVTTVTRSSAMSLSINVTDSV